MGLSENEKLLPLIGVQQWKKWNGRQWCVLFKKYSENYSELKRCALRALVMQSTVHVCRSLNYVIKTSRKEINIPESLRNNSVLGTRFYGEDYVYMIDKDPSKFKKFSKCNVKVVNGDCIEASFVLKEKLGGKSVCMLNMANRWEPSAGWPMHWGTQEEQIFRRSNIYQCLDNDIDNIEKDRNWEYPIDEFGQIFSPEVVFFRSSEKDGSSFIRPRTIGVLTAAALASPPVYFCENEESFKLKDSAAKMMRRKMSLLFKVCLEHGFTNIILSAWGSGAFRTPPKHIAELFKEEISKISPYFENVWFAILEDGFSFRKWNKGGNLAPYEEVFQQKAEKIEYKYDEF